MEGYKSSSCGMLLVCNYFVMIKRVCILKGFIFIYWILVMRSLYLDIISEMQVCYFRYMRFYPSGRFLYKVRLVRRFHALS